MRSKMKKKPIINAEDILIPIYTSYPPKEEEIREMHSDILNFMRRREVKRIGGLPKEILSHQRRLLGL